MKPPISSTRTRPAGQPREMRRELTEVLSTGRPVSEGHVLTFRLAVLLSFAALALRLFQIDHQSLWLDEGYTLLFSHLSLTRLFLVGGAHEHPPLYYFLVHALLHVDNWYLVARLLSAVAGAISVFVLYALGVKLYGHIAGLVAAALLTVSPFQIWYSQEARGYELAGLFVLLSYFFIFTGVERPRGRTWLLYVACTAAALYTEYTTIFVLVPQAVLLARARRAGCVRALLGAWAGITLLYAPWVVTLALDAASIAGRYWIPSPTPTTVANTVLEFLGILTPCPSPPCNGTELSLPLLQGNEMLLALVVVAAVLASLLVAFLRRDVATQMVCLWLVLPFGLVLLLAIRRSLYLDRVFLDATYGLYLLLGAGIAQSVRWRPALALVSLLVALIAAAGIASLEPVYANINKPDWKSASHDFASAYRPGQAVIFYPGVLSALTASYLPAGWRATREEPLWTHTYLDVPGWQKKYPRLSDAQLRNLQLSEVTRNTRQVWLLTEDYTGLNDTRHWMITHGFQVAVSQVYRGDARIELFDRQPPSRFGPPVLLLHSFHSAWQHTGNLKVRSGVATQSGTGTLTRSFPVKAGTAYRVNIQYRGLPPAGPNVEVETFDRAGKQTTGIVIHSGRVLASFPRTEWYDMPVNDTWIWQPFGFVAPPGSVRATLLLQNRWGSTEWRRIGVYAER